MKTSSEFVIQFGCLVAYRGQNVKIEIPAGVTSIGRRAFYQSGIIEAVLPDTVTEIEAEAFNCSSLKTLLIGGTINKIGAGAFLHNEELFKSMLQQIPVASFSKADRDYALQCFLDHEETLAYNNDVREQNLAYIGKNASKPYFSELLCDALIGHEELFYEVIRLGLIPSNNLDVLIEHLHEKEATQLVAALLAYKQNVKKPAKKRVNKELDLLDDEPSIADWRKLFRFKYTGDGIEITGCMIQDDVIDLPRTMGKKPVRIIGSKAFDGHSLPDKETFKIKLTQNRRIIIPEGVTEIKTGAFYCLNNREIYIPKSVKELPEGMLVAVNHIILYVPSILPSIPDDLVWDSSDGSVEIKRFE